MFLSITSVWTRKFIGPVRRRTCEGDAGSRIGSQEAIDHEKKIECKSGEKRADAIATMMEQSGVQ